MDGGWPLADSFRRTDDLQRGYSSKLEGQKEDLKGIIVSKTAQIKYLEEKVATMKLAYGDKLAVAQAKIGQLEQDLRRQKHSQAHERTAAVDKLTREHSALALHVKHLKKANRSLVRLSVLQPTPLPSPVIKAGAAPVAASRPAAAADSMAAPSLPHLSLSLSPSCESGPGLIHSPALPSLSHLGSDY